MLPRPELEARVLRALQERLRADPVACDAFCRGFLDEENRLRREHRTQVATAPRELAAVNRRSKEILELLLNGFRDESWKAELRQIEQRRTALEALIAAAAAEPVLPALHPHMADLYREKVQNLAAALAHDDEAQREAARTALRGFIEAIVIPPGEALRRVVGDLRRMLTAAAGPRDGAALATVVESGCGGPQPAEFGVRLGRRMSVHGPLGAGYFHFPTALSPAASTIRSTSSPRSNRC